MSTARSTRVIGMAFSLMTTAIAARGNAAGDVVIYCSQDQEHAETLLKDFEKQTGIHVRAEYDVEAAKSVGLTQKIYEERSHPRCDVFWNNEPLNTIFLKNEGALAPYLSPNAATIPAEFKDAEGHWTGFAARARILIVNDEKVKPEDRPKSYRDLIAAKYRGQCVIAKPLAGTTATHMIALYQVLGEPQAKAFLATLSNDIGVVPGNAHVMRQVRDGVASWGFTDTDDFWVAKSEGFKVSAVYPDQGEGEIGTLVLPNTVALIKGAPNADNGKKLIDYLLSEEIEKRLANGRSAQIPLHPNVARPEHVKAPGKDFRAMKVDFQALAGQRVQRLDELKSLFLK